MSRIQTLLWLRHRLWWNGLRSKANVADTVAAVILAVLGAIVSVALAAALAFVLHLGISRGDPDSERVALLIVFWVVAFLAVGLPVIFGVAQSGVPLDRLLHYPVGRGALYRISLAGSFANSVHFFWYPSLLALSLVALVLNHVPIGGWVVVNLVFAVCLVVWCHAILLLVQHVLKGRRIKELAVLVGLVVLVAASILPSAISSRSDGSDLESLPLPVQFTGWLARPASVLPPSIAVEGLTASMAGDNGGVAGPVAWLVVWTAGGSGIGFILLVHLLLGGGGGPRVKAGAQAAKRGSGFFSVDRLRWISETSRAVAARDLHYLLRSTVGKFNIVIMPLFVVMMGLVVVRDLTAPVLGVDRSSLVFIGIMVYASMFSNNFLYNAYAWEGAGIRSYFIAPVAPREVVFGKNLGLWLYNIILLVECVASYAVIVGLPGFVTGISGCCAFAAGLLSSTIAGNFVSPALPVARNISKIGSSPSQTGVFISFAMLFVNVIVIGGIVVIGAMAASPWVLPVLLSILVAILAASYRAMLAPAARLLEDRKESLIEAVQSPT